MKIVISHSKMTKTPLCHCVLGDLWRILTQQNDQKHPPAVAFWGDRSLVPAPRPSLVSITSPGPRNPVGASIRASDHVFVFFNLRQARILDNRGRPASDPRSFPFRHRFLSRQTHSPRLQVRLLTRFFFRVLRTKNHLICKKEKKILFLGGHVAILAVRRVIERRHVILYWMLKSGICPRRS